MIYRSTLNISGNGTYINNAARECGGVFSAYDRLHITAAIFTAIIILRDVTYNHV